jgi:hypothetical protein
LVPKLGRLGGSHCAWSLVQGSDQLVVEPRVASLLGSRFVGSPSGRSLHGCFVGGGGPPTLRGVGSQWSLGDAEDRHLNLLVLEAVRLALLELPQAASGAGSVVSNNTSVVVSINNQEVIAPSL